MEEIREVGSARRAICVYVDVDDTLIRSSGAKRIPVPHVIETASRLYGAGAALFCWSSGGVAYARSAAEECGIADCFRAFLPKPDILVDDRPLAEWKRLQHVLPTNLTEETLARYWPDVLDLEEA